MVVINNSDETRTFSTKRFAENMQNFTSGTEVMSGEKLTHLESITINPKSSLIIELKK
jgi:hypothetical protein